MMIAETIAARAAMIRMLKAERGGAGRDVVMASEVPIRGRTA